MPLPNLDFKPRMNGDSYSNNTTAAVSDLGPSSYREQIRDRLQNTPRGGGGPAETLDSSRTARINLSLFGAAADNQSSYYRPLSRNNPDQNLKFLSSGERDSTSRRGTSAAKRQIVLYNKNYVPSKSEISNNNDDDDNDDVVMSDEHPNKSNNNEGALLRFFFYFLILGSLLTLSILKLIS